MLKPFTSWMHWHVSVQCERWHGRERCREVMLELTLMQLRARQHGLAKGIEDCESDGWTVSLICWVTFNEPFSHSFSIYFHLCKWGCSPWITLWSWFRRAFEKLHARFVSQSLCNLLMKIRAVLVNAVTACCHYYCTFTVSHPWYKEDFSLLRDVRFSCRPTSLGVGRWRP